MERIACLLLYLLDYLDVRSGLGEQREYKRCRLGMWLGLLLAIALWLVAISYLPAWGNQLDAAAFGERFASVVFTGLASVFSALSIWFAWRLWRAESLLRRSQD
ncbi:hypothetical protein JFK97_05760 [Chromobacterium phragmitis]|uniref:hypothetical protein n=1 Tax=Chromobacterium amazonense TaxID=1382803 RepID=UPI0021B7BC0A|nr:hypothetical protein [Chromobacterium amazonense]MBM2883890.1 hypothetical protein [Chromobacterium amazonense]MDE1711807.1 hypothetical protein [Chromobacterium amazonense]